MLLKHILPASVADSFEFSEHDLKDPKFNL